MIAIKELLVKFGQALEVMAWGGGGNTLGYCEAFYAM